MISIEEKQYWIWLTTICKIGNKKIKKLLIQYKTPKRIYDATFSELMQVDGIDTKIANIIINSRKKEIIDQVEYIENNNIEIIPINSRYYPLLLRNIYDSPICLYIKGNKKILNNIGIGIIGSRMCTIEGARTAKKIAYDLAKNEINIISGLARGIDVSAHIGAIYAKKPTIAILGSGLDSIYPSEHKKVVDKILEYDGTVISEYPIFTKPEKHNFIARNRIISGISNGILVVEAKNKSGTSLTVDFALEQGRDIFAIPGSIYSENSGGTNNLIKNGAKLVDSYMDILEEYNLLKKE